MVSVWSNEQAIREIYLKPFEISVKEGGANAVMVSWSFLGNKWTGENSGLLNTVLRDEWGFRGMALTDFFRNNGHGFMNADAALANGVDAMLSTFDGEENNVAKYSIMTYVLNSKDFAITGGEFGIESSVISLFGYIIVAGIAFFMIKSRKN